MMEQLQPLTESECEELCALWSLTCMSVGLTTMQASRADSLGKRIRIQRPPPLPTPPGQMPPTITIPKMTPAEAIA
jgi:hypothetical protein